ncbi:hypothetical protein DVH24_034152 [Malus domestica]|uniref:Uncharacterized protein n=1 Tax=Malus domestica TaxID=3750 RepID=A0A498IAF9_MALDO|nr:hypothetical protein DVH24_034152 [Malus domestica]
MDVSVVKFSCYVENMASIVVIEWLDPISKSPHGQQIFTYEGIQSADDCANFGTFATPYGKTYLSLEWRNYISHVGQEFPGGVN